MYIDLGENVNQCSQPVQYDDTARPPAGHSWHNSATSAATPDAVSESPTAELDGCAAVTQDHTLVNCANCRANYVLETEAGLDWS